MREPAVDLRRSRENHFFSLDRMKRSYILFADVGRLYFSNSSTGADCLKIFGVVASRIPPKTMIQIPDSAI